MFLPTYKNRVLLDMVSLHFWLPMQVMHTVQIRFHSCW